MLSGHLLRCRHSSIKHFNTLVKYLTRLAIGQGNRYLRLRDTFSLFMAILPSAKLLVENGKTRKMAIVALKTAIVVKA